MHSRIGSVFFGWLGAVVVLLAACETKSTTHAQDDGATTPSRASSDGGPATATTGVHASAPSSSASAELAARMTSDAGPSASASASASAASSIPPRPLPSPDRLTSPFKGTAAHGFVAIANTTSARTDRMFAAVNSTTAIDPDRPVLVASFTKLWTAVAILRLVERNELSLDGTIKELLPDLASRPWSDSTLRELLSHTSRVPEFDEKLSWYRKSDVDFSTPVDMLAKGIPRDWTEKRGIYKYRNAEYALAGAILSLVSKQSAALALKAEVFDLAGMKNAGLLVGPIEKAPEKPAGLDLTPMGGIRPHNFFTAGAGYASAADLLAFFEALQTNKLLSAASKTLLFDGVASRGDHALGCWSFTFALSEGGTTRLVERPGSFGNIRLQTIFFPEQGRAIVAWNGDGVEIVRPKLKGSGQSLARIALE